MVKCKCFVLARSPGVVGMDTDPPQNPSPKFRGDWAAITPLIDTPMLYEGAVYTYNRTQ